MFKITPKGRQFIDHEIYARAGCAAWVRADAVANYERFRQRFPVRRQAQPLPPA